MNFDYLLNRFSDNSDLPAIIWKNNIYTYNKLSKKINFWRKKIKKYIQYDGMVVELKADFSFQAVAILIVLIEKNCIIVPLTQSIKEKREEFRKIAEIELIIDIDKNDKIGIQKINNTPINELILSLRKKANPGLILFSSGSTGKSKAALHDFFSLLKKFETPRHSKRIITFLLFDHIGGINTLFYTLYNSGCVIAINDRSQKSVCEAIQNHKAQILPTSPTFLNLLLLNDEYKKYDLSSLEIITYGTEMMHESTLKKLNIEFPKVKLQQTYGLSEIGIMRSKSKSSDSLYMKIGGDGYDIRVVDGLLEVKAKSAMLGYLNADSPFTEDGWFKTGDAVEVDGDYLKILGRKSEIINVGGEKVYPAEVENILQMMDNVEEVAVNGEPNAITGNIVKAKIKLLSNESISEFRLRMRKFCHDKLENYKIPQKIMLTNNIIHSERFKKMRKEI